MKIGYDGICIAQSNARDVISEIINFGIETTVLRNAKNYRLMDSCEIKTCGHICFRGLKELCCICAKITGKRDRCSTCDFRKKLKGRKR